MNRDRVLVALDRGEARYIWDSSVHGGLLVEEETSDALRAALDTDREELEALVIRAMMNVGKVNPTFGDYAGAILAVLEGGSDA